MAAGTTGVALADVDLDRDLDIFVTNTFPSAVFSLENRGDNVFGPPTFDTGLTPTNSGIGVRSVLIGDFDGLGEPDLIVAGFGDARLSVLTANDSGGFDTPVLYPVLSPVVDVASGDFDGDNDLDLAVITADGGTAISHIIILANEGDGTFVQLQEIDVALGTGSIVAGHLNDDENLDLAIVSSFRSSSSELVSILLGSGEGGFAGPITIPVNRPGQIIIADVNGDSVNDLIIGQGAQTLAVLINNGDGSFGTLIEIPVIGFTTNIAVADVDADGDVDVIYEDTSNLGCRLSMLPGLGGTFGEPICLNSDRSFSFDRLALDDLDGDDVVDIVVTTASSASLAYLAGNGDGTFQPPAIFAIGIRPALMAIGDLDGDGDADLAVVRDRSDPTGPPVVAVIRNRLLP